MATPTTAPTITTPVATPAPAPGGAGTPAPSSTGDFITQLQGQLLNQSGIISSSNTNLENQMQTAMNSVQQAGTATDQGINANFQGQEDAAQQAGQTKLTSQLTTQGGFGQNVAALNQLMDQTKKQVSDLDLQRQQALATGDAATASKIADLQVQSITFQQQAQQQVFSNLLGMGDFAQKQQSNDLAQQSQDFGQQQAISTVALKYGLTVSPNDTLASITTKAMPYASQEEKLQLQQIQSQITANNAQTQKALNDIQSNQPLDPTTLAALGSMMLSNPNAVLGVVKDTAQLGQVASAANSAANKQFPDIIASNVTNGTSKSDTIGQIMASPFLNIQDKTKLVDQANEAYSSPTPTSSTLSSLPNATKAAVGASSQGLAGVLNFVSGTNFFKG